MTPREALGIVLDATAPGYSTTPRIVEACAVLLRTIEQHEAALALVRECDELRIRSGKLFSIEPTALHAALTKGNP